jgi:hypothetical protein
MHFCAARIVQEAVNYRTARLLPHRAYLARPGAHFPRFTRTILYLADPTG